MELIASAIVLLMMIFYLRPSRKKDKQPQLDREKAVKELVTAAATLDGVVERHLQAAEIVGFSPVEAARKPLDLYLRDIAPLMKALKKLRGEDA